MTCPCGLGDSPENCCLPYIRGDARPETAETLMRARYSAYALEETDFVMSTHHPKTAGDIDRDGVDAWSRESEWEGLEVIETEAGGPDDETGVVEFKARYEAEGRVFVHHEVARFSRVEGAWVYVDGDRKDGQPVRREGPKIGRNDPCPCGSGKKYKKCCGKVAA